MRRRGVGAVACDPVWSEQNGACSDYFGNYINRQGQVLNPLTAQPTGESFIHKDTLLLAGGILLLVLLTGGRR